MFQLLAQNYTTSIPTTTSTHYSALIWLFFAFLFVVAVIEIAGMWRVFQKAGRPGWAAIIPIYNYWVLFEIAGKPGWWALVSFLGFIPVLGYVAGLAFLILEIIAVLELAKRFGKSQVFAIVGLVIFGFVGYPILGFGDAKYNAGGTSSGAKTPPATTPTATAH